MHCEHVWSQVFDIIDLPDLVATREADTGWVRASTVLDVDLEAADVWLRIASTGVEGDSLGTDEVVARGERLGHSEGPLSAIGVEYFGSPGGGGASVSVFGDLEPRSGSRRLCVRDLGHVDEDWTVVISADSRVFASPCAWLCVHFNGQSAAGCVMSVK